MLRGQARKTTRDRRNKPRVSFDREALKLPSALKTASRPMHLPSRATQVLQARPRHNLGNGKHLYPAGESNTPHERKQPYEYADSTASHPTTSKTLCPTPPMVQECRGNAAPSRRSRQTRRCLAKYIFSLPDVSASAEGLHEGLGSRLRDGAEVVDKVGLGHPDTGVLDGEGVVSLFTRTHTHNRRQKMSTQPTRRRNNGMGRRDRLRAVLSWQLYY